MAIDIRHLEPDFEAVSKPQPKAQSGFDQVTVCILGVDQTNQQRVEDSDAIEVELIDLRGRDLNRGFDDQHAFRRQYAPYIRDSLHFRRGGGLLLGRGLSDRPLSDWLLSGTRLSELQDGPLRSKTAALRRSGCPREQYCNEAQTTQAGILSGHGIKPLNFTK